MNFKFTIIIASLTLTAPVKAVTTSASVDIFVAGTVLSDSDTSYALVQSQYPPLEANGRAVVTSFGASYVSIERQNASAAPFADDVSRTTWEKTITNNTSEVKAYSVDILVQQGKMFSYDYPLQFDSRLQFGEDTIYSAGILYYGPPGDAPFVSLSGFANNFGVVNDLLSINNGYPGTGIVWNTYEVTLPLGELLPGESKVLRYTNSISIDGIGYESYATGEVSTGLDTDELKDSDGDGLYDVWEESDGGIDSDGDGEIDLNLYDLGARKFRKDIFLEIDTMVGMAVPDASINLLRDAFDDRGINLHIDYNPSDPIPVRDYAANDVLGADFKMDKAQYFGQEDDSDAVKEAKKFFYHYQILARTQSDCATNQDTCSLGFGEILGNDSVFYVHSFRSTGLYVIFGKTNHAILMMHELGHNLNLRHGGSDDVNCKPNYISVMNYALTTKDSWNWLFFRLDYSFEKLPTLDQDNLFEADGIGASPPNKSNAKMPFNPIGPDNRDYLKVRAPNPADWNDNGQIDTQSVGGPTVSNITDSIEICKATPNRPAQVLVGHDDWSKLVFNFRKSAQYTDSISTLVADQDFTGATLDALSNLEPVLGEDFDEDLIFDESDNCPLIANPDQLDSDNDGYGNFCDVDYDNNCIVDLSDYVMLTEVFLQPNTTHDLNGDGLINFLDIARFFQMYGEDPGPGLFGSVCD